MGHACDGCGANPGEALPRCIGCKSRRYCCSACQKAAWRAGHKHECGTLRAALLAQAQTPEEVPLASAGGGGPDEGATLAQAAAEEAQRGQQRRDEFTTAFDWVYAFEHSGDPSHDVYFEVQGLLCRSRRLIPKGATIVMSLDFRQFVLDHPRVLLRLRVPPDAAQMLTGRELRALMVMHAASSGAHDADGCLFQRIRHSPMRFGDEDESGVFQDTVHEIIMQFKAGQAPVDAQRRGFDAEIELCRAMAERALAQFGQLGA